MVKSKNSNQYLILSIALVFYGTALFTHHQFSKPQINVSKQDSAVNINRDFLKITSLGNKRLISSWLWIQTLLELDHDRYSKRDKNNWLYHRFKTISELDPLFYENYYYGGVFLSIIKDDLLGAADIYELGLLKYPDDYKLNYNAGFNYYFELGDFKKGLEKLDRIKDYPQTPQPIKFVINKLRFEVSYNYDAAIEFLFFTLEQTKDESIKNKIHKEIYALKAERDLDCLNSGKNNCHMKDAEGNQYVKNKGKWESQKKFKKFRITLPPNKAQGEE